MAAATKKSPKDLLGSLSPNITLIIVWVVGAVAILAGYFFLFYSPLVEEREAEETHHTALIAEKTTEETNLRRYNSDVADLARARQHVQDLQLILPADPDIPGFMRNINSLAEASGLQIGLIQPLDERTEVYYARIPVQLNVRGSYLELARFFHAVSQLPRVINMENIKLRTPTVDPTTNEVRLEATVLATTFRSVQSPAAAARAAAAGAGGAPGAPATPGAPAAGGAR